MSKDAAFSPFTFRPGTVIIDVVRGSIKQGFSSTR
jgi:hypothetical protein